jgi:hypothetical protein
MFALGLAACGPMYPEVSCPCTTVEWSSTWQTHYNAGVQAVIAEPIFHDEVAPYGQWIDTAYGRVWRPDSTIVGADFVPYASGGQWVSTRQGWSFESEYPFGWVTFHYGRWFRHPNWGWVWLPAETWGPSWVEFRTGDGVIAWAPSPPANAPNLLPRHPDVWMVTNTFAFTKPDVKQYAYRGNQQIYAWRRAAPMGVLVNAQPALAIPAP